MPATSLNVTFCSPPSARRARERPKLPSAPIGPPPPARRARKTNRPMSRITGPKPRIRLARIPRLWFTGSASMITPFSSRSWLRSSLASAKVGISVSKFFVGSASSYLKSFLNLPSTVSPWVETRSTLPARTCSRNVGLYGMRTGSRPAGGEDGHEEVVGREEAEDEQQDLHPRPLEGRLLRAAGAGSAPGVPSPWGSRPWGRISRRARRGSWRGCRAMDVTRVVPRAGFVVAVAMVLALATASAASAQSTVGKNAGGNGIVYTDPGANVDQVFLDWAQNSSTDDGRARDRRSPAARRRSRTGPAAATWAR